MENFNYKEEERLKELLKGNENPFSTPPSYFDNLSGDILHKIETLPDFNGVAPTTPFGVPDHYFENLSTQITDRVIASKNARKPSLLASLFRPTIAIPLAFASIVLIASIIYFNQNKNINLPVQEFTSEDLDESDFLQNIDESVFVDLITFDNTNIKEDSLEEYLLDNEIDISQLENEL